MMVEPFFGPGGPACTPGVKNWNRLVSAHEAAAGDLLAIPENIIADQGFPARAAADSADSAASSPDLESDS